MGLTSDDRAEVAAAMKDVAQDGLEVARHLRGEIYEVRATGENKIYRVLFAAETKYILLALDAFAKTTQKTPPAKIKLAEKRLADWRSRAKKPDK